MSPATARRRQIIEVLAAAFAEPIGKDSAGFRTKVLSGAQTYSAKPL